MPRPPSPLACVSDDEFRVAPECPALAPAFDGADLVVWPRRLGDSLRAYVEDLLSGEAFDRGADGMADDVASALGSTLPDQPGRSEFVADMARLASVIGHDLGHGRVSARLELLDRDACRLFHVDRIDVRLLTTYAGPGTQYLAHRDVLRAGLGSGDNVRIVRAGATIRSLDTGGVGLFRGEREGGDPSHRRGVVHRSPPIRATRRRRLLFKVQPAGKIAG
jgi:hypothetical protein